MSTATSVTNTQERGSVILGTAMMVSWTLVIGIGGLVLFLAIAYGLTSRSHMLVVVSSCLLAVPLLLTVAWGIALANEIMGEKKAERTILVQSRHEGYCDHRARISYVPNFL